MGCRCDAVAPACALSAQTVRFGQPLFHGDYIEHFGRRSATLDASTSLELAPWACRVYVQRTASPVAGSP